MEKLFKPKDNGLFLLANIMQFVKEFLIIRVALKVL